MGHNSHSCVPCLVAGEWIQMCTASDRLSYTSQLHGVGERENTTLTHLSYTLNVQLSKKSAISTNYLPGTTGFYPLRHLLGKMHKKEKVKASLLHFTLGCSY